MKIVLAHGVFDVLHIGHIRLLKKARSFGDGLIVSLLSDEYVRLYKGPMRPVYCLKERIEHIRELRCVDQVVVVDGPGHEAVQEMIVAVGPAVYVKGADTKGKFAEESFVRSLGIRIEYVDMEIVGGDRPISSSRVIGSYA